MKYTGGTRFVLVMVTAFALTLSKPSAAGDAEANALFVQAVSAIKSSEQTLEIREKLDALNQAVSNLDLIVSEHPTSSLAVSIVTGQSVGNVNPEELRKKRDELQSQVAQEDANIAAEAQAEEQHRVWVEATMACVDDLACMQDMYLAEYQRQGLEGFAKFNLASIEALYHGFSRQFENYYAQCIELLPDEDSIGNEAELFLNTISAAIAVESAKDVYSRIRSFKEQYTDPDNPGVFDEYVIMPAIFATAHNLPKVSNQYLNLMVGDGYFDGVEEAEAELFQRAHFISKADILEIRDRGLPLEDRWSNVPEDFVRYLALTVSPDFEEYWTKTYGSGPYSRGENHRSAVQSRLVYLSFSGKALAAADYISSDPALFQDGDAVKWAAEIAIAVGKSKSRKTQNAIRDLTLLGLQEKNDEELSSELVHALLVTSYFLN